MTKNIRWLSMSSLVSLLFVTCACSPENNPKKETTPPPSPVKEESAQQTTTETENQGEISSQDVKKLSEAFGHFIGRNLKTPGVNFDLDSIIKGMKDGHAGKPQPIPDKEYEELMIKLQQQAFNRLATDNLKAANDYMAKNVKEAGVVEVEPGKLQYVILEQGQGEAVQEHGTPKIKYVGKYIDGTTFSSSDETGGPLNIPLDQTIAGFSKGLVGMKEGEKRRLFVHPDLGYGVSGNLPPNALLIFDIEIVKAQSTEEDTNSDEEADDLSYEQDDQIDDEDTDQ